jgi:pimeloyl-ACP methyl ester carboxylesterase
MTVSGRKVGRIWLSVTPGPRPLVFVHELGPGREERERRLAAARQAWGGWVYTQRGHAPSAWAAGRFYRISDFAVDLIRLLHEAVAVPSVLVGEGAGGLVALLAAAAAPESVTHLHLLPGTGPGWSDTPLRLLTDTATVNRGWLDAAAALPAPGSAAQDGDDPVLRYGPAELMHRPAVRAAAAGLGVPWSAGGPHFLQDYLPARSRAAAMPATGQAGQVRAGP